MYIGPAVPNIIYFTAIGAVPQLDLVMEKDGKIIGHVMYVRAQIQADDGRAIPVMTFGPISIAPCEQRKGYGRALLEYSMKKAKTLGAGALCIEGNLDFLVSWPAREASTMMQHREVKRYRIFFSKS